MVNRVRTILSLLGITIGIFAIISVFTVIDSMKLNIQASLAKLGDKVIYVQKWPWEFGPNYPWWKYMLRPLPKISELSEIQNRSTKAEAVVFQIFTNKPIYYKNNYAENIQVVASSHDFDKIRNFEIEKGRYFSPFESQRGTPIVIIGHDLATKLFAGVNPLGKEIKLMGRKVRIIGIFKKEGEDAFNMTLDKIVLLPINFARNIIDIRQEMLGPTIMVKAKEGVELSDLQDELKSIMRSLRRIRPIDDDNFALNKASMATQGFEQIFSVMDLAGIFIGGFSILVGAFGIANIMFVSVNEQTNIIGIQKALGAKRSFILLQFLFEAVILSFIGGAVGLILIFILTFVVSLLTDFNIFLTFDNVLRGIVISMCVGIISGFMPARSAARLKPVEAINKLS